VLDSSGLNGRCRDIALLDQFFSCFRLLSQKVSLHVLLWCFWGLGWCGWPPAGLTIAFVPSTPCLLLSVFCKRIELLLSWWPASVDG